MSASRRIEIAAAENLAVPAESSDAIGLANDLSAEQVIKLMTNSDLCHLVQKNSPRFEAECLSAEKMLRDPAAFFRFPIETVLGPAPVDQVKRLGLVFNAADRKGKLLAIFGQFVSELKGGRSVWDTALLVTDELYTNASKNAWPKEAGLFQGPAAYPGTIEFFAAAEGQNLIIGCRDSYGSLVVGDVMKRINTCFEKGVADSIRHGNGGAGIGSYMVFDACASYYAGAIPGQCTVVCVILPIGMSRKSAAILPKNVHLIRSPLEASRKRDDDAI
jgi:hypothetical protein